MSENQGPAEIGDNSRGIEEAERVQLISVINKITAAQAIAAISKAKAASDQKAVTQLFRLGKAAGFPRHELEDRIAKMDQSGRDVADEEKRRARHYKWLGILDEEQLAMISDEGTPIETKDEYHWRGEGWKAGLRGLIRKPPPECPERFVQAFLEDFDKGTESALDAMKAANPKLASTGSVVKDVKEKARKDFKAETGLDPKISETPDPEAVEKAARKQAADWGLEKGKPKGAPVNLAK